MIGIIEVTPQHVTVYDAAGKTVWRADLTVANGRRYVRDLAAQILKEKPDTIRFDANGRNYRVEVGPNLASRLAAVSW
jgi:hypothetical protein